MYVCLYTVLHMYTYTYIETYTSTFPFQTLEVIGGYLGLLSCRSWCKCMKIGKEVQRAFLEEMEDYQAHGPVSTLLAPPWLAVLVGRA